MQSQSLVKAVRLLAEQVVSYSDVDLGQPWSWGPHSEGIRFVVLGTYQELQELAVALRAERQAAGLPITQAQHILAQKNAVMRDLQVVFLTASESNFDEAPAPGEWPLRTVLAHIVGAERTFFSLVHYAVRRTRSAEVLPVEFPNGEVERLMGSRKAFGALFSEGSPADLLDYCWSVHERALNAFADITDAELESPSIWWEELSFPARHRLHRFAAHAVQHIAQAEKTLVAQEEPAGEGQRLLRPLFAALADVEASLIGAPDLGADRCAALAEVIAQRAEEASEVIRQAKALMEAIQSDDLERIGQLAEQNPEIVNASGPNGLSAMMNALYANKQAVVEALAEAGAEFSIFEAAAAGRNEIVRAKAAEWPEVIDLYAGDGFTPLHLACYFGQEEIALWLIENGADVNAKAKNDMRIRPLHAAAASGSHEVLAALLAKGADVNVSQAGGFTPLHQAAHRGDAEMARLFLEYGADANATNEQGRTARDIAKAGGHQALAQDLAEAAQ